MKKNAKVVAVDDNGRIEVLVRFRSPKFTLTSDETKQVARAAAEKIADAIRSIPFLNFGPSNTTVTL